MEEWRDVPSFAGLIQVSSLGRVKSFCRYSSGAIMTQFHDPVSGYQKVTLQLSPGRKKTVRVHRLVCEAFHGAPPSESHEVAHSDGKRTNNRPENLRWATCKENSSDCLKHGTRLFGERNPSAKLTDDQWLSLLEERQAGASYRELGRRFNVHESSIRERLRKLLA